MEGRLPDPMVGDGNLNENFNKFFQSFETYLIATEKDTKPDKVKIALLLNLIGPVGIEIYNILKVPNNGSYDSVVAEFKKYCAPRRNKTYERFIFNSRNQSKDEPFDHFLSDVKKLIQSCEYDSQEDSILIDRIVLGINDVSVQEKLLNIQNLKLDRAIEICRTSEVTKKQLSAVRSTDAMNQSVDELQLRRTRRVEAKQEKLSKSRCQKCNGLHGYGKCPAFGKKCFKCGKPNHFSNVCFNESQGVVKKVREITKKSSEDSCDSEEDLFVHSLREIGEIKGSGAKM